MAGFLSLLICVSQFAADTNRNESMSATGRHFFMLVFFRSSFTSNNYIWLITMFRVKQFCLWCSIVGRLFVACPPTRPERRRAQTFACMSASLWTASSSARQTAHLSASMSTTATKHLPGLRIRLAYPLPKF